MVYTDFHISQNVDILVSFLELFSGLIYIYIYIYIYKIYISENNYFQIWYTYIKPEKILENKISTFVVLAVVLLQIDISWKGRPRDTQILLRYFGKYKYLVMKMDWRPKIFYFSALQ
jgi:hypothetical protein